MKILSIVNGKGGVGKSTTCAHIAYRSAERKKRTLVIDLDTQKNVTGAIAEKDLLKKEASAANLVYSEKATEPVQINEYLHILPAAENLTRFETDQDVDAYFKLQEKLQSLKEKYDLVVIDTPGNLAARVVCSLVAADACVVPVELQGFSVETIKDTLGLIDKIKSRYNQKLRFLGLIGNKYDNTRKKEKEIRESLEQIFPNKIMGIIGNRASITDALSEENRVPVWKYRKHGKKDEKACQEVKSTVDNILNKLFPN